MHVEQFRRNLPGAKNKSRKRYRISNEAHMIINIHRQHESMSKEIKDYIVKIVTSEAATQKR
jgi:adenylosuccinate synthase